MHRERFLDYSMLISTLRNDSAAGPYFNKASPISYYSSLVIITIIRTTCWERSKIYLALQVTGILDYQRSVMLHNVALFLFFTKRVTLQNRIKINTKYCCFLFLSAFLFLFFPSLFIFLFLNILHFQFIPCIYKSALVLVLPCSPVSLIAVVVS
jgi:hypothetical protein